MTEDNGLFTHTRPEPRLTGGDWLALGVAALMVWGPLALGAFHR